MKMILAHGLSCSKCSKRINSRNGEWAAWNPAKYLLTGYHLAQPILPFFNERDKEWNEIYVKCTSGKYDHKKIMNEVFGLTYDVGTKPITEEELRKICTLGSMGTGERNLPIMEAGRVKHKVYTIGVDWGVSMTASRTVCTVGAIRNDGVYEVIFVKIFSGFDHEAHIHTIARIANDLNAFCVADSGPDPIRGIKLCELTSPTRSQLATYRRSKVIQHYDEGQYDWRQNRWVLHRTDVISLIIRQLKAGKILFPNWEEVSDYMQDILNVYVEVRDGMFGQDMFYGHKDSQPDDAIHSLLFAVCAAYMAVGDISLQGASSSSREN
jgi:hypothetical protein